MVARRCKPATEAGRTVRNQFARNVRDLRLRRGLTQIELAKASKLCRPFVSQLESGHFSATLDTVAALASALGVRPVTLLSDIAVPNSDVST
jgi:transcriptional regulator with XRE-family HTH domain